MDPESELGRILALLSNTSLKYLQEIKKLQRDEVCV